MIEIKILRLSLENFKCHRNLTLNFDGGNASIYGDNASGKTSVYDALTWLLFGKDSQGNGEKNIEIKPLDATGEVRDHDALTAVEAVLDVNGEELTLRRTYREVWTTKRGSSQATFDGNTSEYYVSGVPCKKNAFQEKVNELVDEDTFRMLTSVSHFASGISWQDRRAVLFKVAGVMDDQQILATNEAFTPLVESMGRLSMEEYKRKMLAAKKKFVGAKTEIPARISECQKTIEGIQGLDFAKAKAQVDALQATLNGVSEQIVAIEHDSAADQKRMEIREAQLELTALENENRAYRDSQTAGQTDTKALHQNLSVYELNLRSKQDSLTYNTDMLSEYDSRIDASRSRWISVNGERFAAGNCPTCGQRLPAEQLHKAEDAFEKSKKQRLAEIEQTANALKKAKADTAARIEDIRKEIGELETGIADTMMHISASEAARVEPKDMDGYTDRKDAIGNRINALLGELHDMMTNSSEVLEKLRDEKSDIQTAIRDQMAIVSKESLLDHARQRADELRQDARNAAECLESIEKMLYLMDEYSRYKTRFVEDSINGLFRIARFRLFREQANGGVEDRCDVVYDGIPYISVNNGMKINLGIDIINTLSLAYGVRVPLFVDNAESVTNLEKCGSQIVRLVVSENDKELRVNYEN